MPLVNVVINPFACGPNSDDFCKRSNLSVFGMHVQRFVADALTCDNPHGKLVPGDVEIVIRKRNEGCLEMGGEKYGVQITVQANEYPERSLNLTQRTVRIKEDLQGILPPEILAYVWVILFPAAFVELQS